MKINIASNIRTYRKNKKMTQEQLAEVLGVTLGAVSKWELGVSTPDLALIVEMAAFFETSVDVLLGYGFYSDSLNQVVKRIKKMRGEKKFEEATAEAEKALQKYPNSFEIVFQSAALYRLKGLEYRCQKSFQRSLDLYFRSLDLISQNTDPCVNEWTIRNHIAELNLYMGNNEEALEQLKKNNAGGLNNGQIGNTLSVAMRKPDEALEYLSDALIEIFSNSFGLTIGFCNAYCQKENYESADAMMQWMWDLIRGLKQPGVISYLDKAEAQLLTGWAIVSEMAGNMEQAKKCLSRAIPLAQKFDENPDYSFAGMRFFHSNVERTGFDDFGNSALQGIRKMLSENEKDTRLSEMLIQLLEQQT